MDRLLAWLGTAVGTALVLAALTTAGALAQTATDTPTSVTTATATGSPATSATASMTDTPTATATVAPTPTSTAAPLPAVPHDNRYFGQTGFRIDNDTVWNYFQRRGGVATFGAPTSRTFTFQGFTVQFFQRRIVQLDQSGHARLLNVLDPGLLPYVSFNGSTFPGVDTSLMAGSPDPTNQTAVLAWVQQHAPNSVIGAPTNFFVSFQNTVPPQVAFPNGGNTALLPGIDLEMWGIPTSAPIVDPNNHNFIYLRWQRGIMMYDAGCTCTQGILLADYLKDVLTGQNLPADLAQEAAASPFLNQYDPSAPNWVHNATLLPNTDLTNAFTQG